MESIGAELELVAVVKDQKLIIYLDKADTNEPVVNATIEVSADDAPPLVAEPVGAGTYSLNAKWINGTGTKALTFVVSSGDTVELLNGTLDLTVNVGADEHGAAQSSSLSASPTFWFFAFLASVLGFLLAFAFRPVGPPAERAEDGEAPRRRPKLDVVGGKKGAAHVALLIVVFASMASPAAAGGAGHDHGPQGHDEPAAAGGYVPRKLPEGDVFLPKPSQRLLMVRTDVAAATKVQAGEELIGTVIADPASEGRVQAPMDGEIELAGAGVAFVGEEVKAGDLLALLVPAMPVYERGYLEQLTAEVDGKLRIAEQRLRRLQGVSSGFVAERDIEDTLAELVALRERKRVLEPKSGQKIALKAPVDGIISVANVRAGQVVNGRDTLFEIVDPKRLWIEAIGIAGQDYGDVAEAYAVLGDGQSFPIQYVGSAPSLRHQARPLFFKVVAPDAALAIGTRVQVIVQKGSPVEGVVLPESAVVRGANGLAQVWVKVGPERFKPKTVRTEPLGGAKILVTAGLGTGSRVVISGAEFINQVR